MSGFFKFIFKIFRSFLLLSGFVIALGAGMALGGFYLLDFIITGQEIEMPNLYGKPKAAAIEILTEKGLGVYPIKEVKNENTVAGIVIEQRPNPGYPVKKGRGVYLTVSAGPESYMIPDVIGKREDEAGFILSALELQVGSRAVVSNPNFPKDTVIGQDPPSGPRLLQGKKVNILVSNGAETPEYVMPNLTGADIFTVKTQIATKPFNLSENDITYRQSEDPNSWNKILKQRPEAGTKFTSDEKLRLVASSSGTHVSGLRMVRVNFPVLETMLAEKLVLVVWDDYSKVFQSLSVIPVKMNPAKTKIDMHIPVFGNTMVMLSIDNGTNFPFYKPLAAQYFDEFSDNPKLSS